MREPITTAQAKRIIELQEATRRIRAEIADLRKETFFKVHTGRRGADYREMATERISGQIGGKLGGLIIRELIAMKESAIAANIRELNQLGGAIPTEAAP